MSNSAAAKSAQSGEATRTDNTQKAKSEQPVRTEATTPAPRRKRKSREAFRTISEVADLIGVQQHVLRFWETKFPQIKPLKRGGGRRYYRPENIELLKKIHDLLYVQGYTIKGVQRLLKQNRGSLPETKNKAQPVEPEKASLDTPEQGDLLGSTSQSTGASDTQAKPATSAQTTAQSSGMPGKVRSELQTILRDLKDTRQLLSDRGL